jgi:hypothetical protein
LREFTLEILLASLTAPPRVTKPPAIVAKRPGGWPRGRPRGHKSGPRSPAVVATMKLAQQRRRDAEKKRAKRAAARAAAKANGGNGSSSTEAAATKSATKLWQHAEKLQPKAPWRAIVREFGVNEAVAQDAHRTHKLPPGITGDAVSRFLELPAD